MATVRQIAVVSDWPLATQRVVMAVAGALVVALAAQVAVPIPGTPVPFTLQVPAVLIVGGLLGPRVGAASLALYVAMGAAGLPVYAPVGPTGFARLIGPTGGYLLAYPVAAATTGMLSALGSWTRIALAVVVGLVVIHAGGTAQLAVLGGDLGVAVRFGSLPFLAGDLLKLAFAALVIRRFGPSFQALH